MAPYNDPHEKQKYENFFFHLYMYIKLIFYFYLLFRLFKLYRYTHDRMHSRIRPLKVHYYVSPTETILGWVCCVINLSLLFYS